MLGKELERAGGIAISLGLPSGSALGQDGIDLGRLHLLAGDAHNRQRALGDVDLDKVASSIRAIGPPTAASGET